MINYFQMNLSKIFILGKKLNTLLKDIQILWEKDLKNSKIESTNQSIAQLYAYFLREILRNKKRSEEITKKLNEEQHYESRKVDDEKFDINNLFKFKLFVKFAAKIPQNSPYNLVEVSTKNFNL